MKRSRSRSLPAAVKKAIKKKFREAEIEKATKEVEDGKTTYEVLLEIGDRPVEVAFKADGTILEIEKEIPFDKCSRNPSRKLGGKVSGGQDRKGRGGDQG